MTNWTGHNVPSLDGCTRYSQRGLIHRPPFIEASVDTELHEIASIERLESEVSS